MNRVKSDHLAFAKEGAVDTTRHTILGESPRIEAPSDRVSTPDGQPERPVEISAEVGAIVSRRMARLAGGRS
jgi:hypothetical protein